MKNQPFESKANIFSIQKEETKYWNERKRIFIIDMELIPFFKVLNEIHYDTAPFRQKDNRNFCFISDYRKKISRTKNFKKNQTNSKMSDQKRQLLINNAFQKCYRQENLSQDQVIDIRNDVNM